MTELFIGSRRIRRGSTSGFVQPMCWRRDPSQMATHNEAQWCDVVAEDDREFQESRFPNVNRLM